MKKFFKRTLSIVLTAFVLLTAVPFAGLIGIFDFSTKASAINSSIKIGDKIQLGSYNGEKITWICAAIDENGPLMVSEKIICFKCFDAHGENSTYHNDGWGYIRKNYGSNCWSDSSIRTWLNSSEARVSYSHCPPNATNVYNGYNAYADESGFLTNFSSYELNLIKTVTNAVNINEWETYRSGYKTGGSTEINCDSVLSYSSSTDFKKYYYQNVTDKVFLLTYKQIAELRENLPDYLKAYPTASAVENNQKKSSSISVNSYASYWTAAVGTLGASFEHVETIPRYGYDANTGASNSCGIRPAFYLNTDIYYMDNYNVLDRVDNDGDTFSVKAYVNREDGTKDYVTGAEVTIYLGDKIVEKSLTKNGIATFNKKELLQFSRNNSFNDLLLNATVSAHYNLNNGVYLCSEDIEPDGCWKKQSLKSLINENKQLIMNEPRMYFSLSIGYVGKTETERNERYQRIKSIISEYSLRLAEMTNGHCFLNEVTIKGYSSDEKLNAARKIFKNPYDIYIFDDPRNTISLNVDTAATFRMDSSFEDRFIAFNYNNGYLQDVVLAHESGHYFFGFLDEYISGNDLGENGGTPWTEKPVKNYGVMDNEWGTIELSTEKKYSYLTESDKTNPVKITKHYSIYHESTEETFANFLLGKCNGMGEYTYSNGTQNATYNYAKVSLPGFQSSAEQNSLENITIQNSNFDLINFNLTAQSEIELEVTDDRITNIYVDDGELTEELFVQNNKCIVSIPNDQSLEITVLKNFDGIQKKEIYYVSNKSGIITVNTDWELQNNNNYSVDNAIDVLNVKNGIPYVLSRSVNILDNYDYNTLCWYKVNGDSFTPIGTDIVKDYTNSSIGSLICSCEVNEPSKYVLMAEKAKQNNESTFSDFAVCNDSSADRIINLSFNDSNDNNTTYTLYYSMEPIDTAIENGTADYILSNSSNMTINVEKNGIYYFALLAKDNNGLCTWDYSLPSFEYKPNDSNNDGIPDSYFDTYSSLEDSGSIAGEDTDDDGLTNLEEYNHGTNPLMPDTDGDNVYDAIEIMYELDPLSPKTDGETDDYIVVYGTPDVKIDWENLKIDSETSLAKINLVNNTDGYAMRTLVNVYVDGQLSDTYTVNIAKQSTVELAIPLEYLENCSDNVRITVDEQQITRDTDYSNNEFIYSASGMDIVTFDANGGSCSTTKKLVYCGNSYGTLPTPTWKYHVFAGWYTADNKPITDSTTVIDINNHTLYAHWNWEGLYPESGTNIFYDSEKEIVYGFGLQKITPDELPSMFTNGNVSLTDSKNEKIVTGTTIEMKDDNGEVFRTIPCVIFGDVNCDGYCDGMDAVTVSCIINGMLTKDDIGTAAFEAADCNRDNQIDENDFNLLVSSGLLISNIPQSNYVTDEWFEYTLDGNFYVVSGTRDIYIEKITVPTSIEGVPVRKIGNNAFASCYAYEIEILNGIQEIGENVFSEYVGRVSLPESIALIADTTFNQVFKDEYQSDYFRAICKFNSYAAEYCLSHGINTIYNDIEVSSGIEIYVKNNEAVVSWVSSYFVPHTTLPEIFIPEYYGDTPVTKIGESSIPPETIAISLPSSITTIDYYAFGSANDLHCVFFRGTEDEWNSINIGSSNNKLLGADIIFNAAEEDKLTVKNNVEPTCTQYGYIEYECPVCTKTFTVNTTPPTGHNIVDGVCTKCRKEYEDCIESTHDYANSTDESWIISKPGASSIDITFSDLTFVENNYDYIYIYDGIGNEVGKYTGDSLASKTITIQGDTVKIRLKTDGSVTKYGLTVTDIKANY